MVLLCLIAESVLIRTNLEKQDITDKLVPLVNSIFKNVPSGVGSKGQTRINSVEDFDELLKLGAKWAYEKGFGTKNDLKHLEEEGCLKSAESKYVSPEAKKEECHNQEVLAREIISWKFNMLIKYLTNM